MKDADPEAFRRIEHGESTVNAEYRKLRNTQIPKPLASPKRPSVAHGIRLPAAVRGCGQARRAGAGTCSASRFVETGTGDITGQRAAIGVAMLPLLQAEAKAEAGNERPRNPRSKTT